MTLQEFLNKELERSTLREIEAKTGVSHAGIQRIVKGYHKSVPDLETLTKIAKAYSIPLWRVLEMAGVHLDLETGYETDIRRLQSLVVKQEDYRQLLSYFLDADRGDLQAILNYFAVSRQGGLPYTRLSLIDRRAFETRRELFALVPRLAADLPSNQNVYEGKRIPAAGSAQTEPSVTVNGRSLRELLKTPQVQYEWGFEGAGPGRLAEAILRYEYGPEIAERYRIPFAIDVIHGVPRSRGDTDWTLDSQEILLWMLLRRLLEQAKA